MSLEENYVLSVVVGTFNRLDRLRECIESILHDRSIPIMVYVTDAGSTDGTIDYLREIASERINVTLHQQKLGQAKAYNEIFAKISTPYVCWLSDDNTVCNRGLEKAVRILDANPRIGMVALKVKDVQGPFSGEAYVGGISEAGILNVNQGVLRTGILRGLGGFSEEFMDYGIDPDLTTRVLYSGHDIVYTKAVAILHSRDWGESNVLRSQMAKQERYKAMYRERYCQGEGQSPVSQFSFRVAGAIKRVLARMSWLLGARAKSWARDWYNIILGRYISLLDPIRSAGREFHLLQRCRPGTVGYYANRPRQEVR